MTSSLGRFLASLNETKVETTCGVYLLMNGDDVVYVGQSTDIQQRLGSHISGMRSTRDGSRLFDRCLWFATPLGERLDYENALIRALRPTLNARIPDARRREAEILTHLGIDPSIVDIEAIAKWNESQHEGSFAWGTAEKNACRDAVYRDRWHGMAYRDIAAKHGIPYGIAVELSKRYEPDLEELSPHVRGRVLLRQELFFAIRSQEFAAAAVRRRKRLTREKAAS